MLAYWRLPQHYLKLQASSGESNLRVCTESVLLVAMGVDEGLELDMFIFYSKSFK